MNGWLPVTYEVWLKQHPEIELVEEMCRSCSGDGQEECPRCHSVIECAACEGKGVVSGAREEYERVLENDMALLKKYRGVP